MEKVVVEEQALALFEHQMDLLALAITADLVGHAGFHGAENGDQALGHSVALGQFPGQILLAPLAGVQIQERPPGSVGDILGGSLQVARDPRGEGAKVLDENPAGVEVGFHDAGLVEMAKGPSKPQTVKTAKRPSNPRGKCVKKLMADAGRTAGCCLHTR